MFGKRHKGETETLTARENREMVAGAMVDYALGLPCDRLLSTIGMLVWGKREVMTLPANLIQGCCCDKFARVPRTVTEILKNKTVSQCNDKTVPASCWNRTNRLKIAVELGVRTRWRFRRGVLLLLSSGGTGANMPPPPAVTEARTRRARHGSVGDSGQAVALDNTTESRSRSAAPTGGAGAGAGDGGAIDDTDDDESRIGRPRVVKREVRFF